jgi:phosphopantothenoylcysteine decarboxylase / phosphopantothenate---cysteine ligase
MFLPLRFKLRYTLLMSLKGLNIILAISGGIAAYKTVELVSQLKKEAANIHVILSSKAAKFVSQLALEVISENKVYGGAQTWGSDIEHIELAKKADLILVAPATANTIAKLASGISDEILFDTVLASKAPVLVCPAMNTNMWEHPTVQANLKKLIDFDYRIVDPEIGVLACKTVGKGRLAELDSIVDKLSSFAQKNFSKFAPELRDEDLDENLFARKVIVTVGATKEKIDPIRFISNRSSGKMGFALIDALLEAGADVTAVHSFKDLEYRCAHHKHKNLTNFQIESAQDMLDTLLNIFPGVDALFMVAAVADYKVKEVSNTKLKRVDGLPEIILEENPDILKELMKVKKANQVLIGFSVESDNAINEGSRKLKEKDLDYIVVNSTKAFGADNADVVIISKDEQETLQASKREIADNLVMKLSRLLNSKSNKMIGVS